MFLLAKNIQSYKMGYMQMNYWFFKKFQLSAALKDTYALSNYRCYNHNISKF
jgi:hypothetical protein